jgi:hypothetical protein
VTRARRFTGRERDNEIAGIHSQKIGNALRTIDTWYPKGRRVGPIAVEPYGSVTTQGKAYRQPKDKQDFYNLLDNWIAQGQGGAAGGTTALRDCHADARWRVRRRGLIMDRYIDIRLLPDPEFAARAGGVQQLWLER